jgi:conjugative transposon TraK protein
LYLADGSAKRVYDDLKENGYYSQVISSNISQELQVDSIVVHQERHPYYFKFFGKERIMRPMSVTIRSLITEGYLRDLQTRTDNNPNGFLIEKWSILENKDIQVQKR